MRAERLELEITEGVFLAEGDSTDETFASLKALGVRLALDDFGTGYSSLGYLKKAPFDKIKIDQSFVRGAASTANNRNAAIIRAIVTLAETLDMDTCAEGVETHDDLQLIRELGVSMVQGFIFGQPTPAEEAREIANNSTIEAAGFAVLREPRHRLMRRAYWHRRQRGRAEAAQYLVDGRPRRMRSRRSRREPRWQSTSSASGRCVESSAGPRPASSACSSTASSISAASPRRRKRGRPRRCFVPGTSNSASARRAKARRRQRDVGRPRESHLRAPIRQDLRLSSENLLTSASGGVTLGYDPATRLYQVAGAATTRFAYDGLNAIADYDGGNTLQHRYVFGPGVDQPIVQYDASGNRAFLGTDERGSVVSLTDSSGTLIGLNRYDEYGKPQSTNLGRFQYTGQMWLPEIGAYYYKARVYLPHLGIFAQTDPIGYGAGMNR